jgi:hypothetical protein
MHLDLVDGGGEEGQVDDVRQVLGGEVADPDGPGVADLLGLHDSAPGVDVFAVLLGGPVDEEEIEVIQPQPGQAGLAGVLRGLEALVGGGQLGGDVELLAGHAGGGDGPPDRLLVPVARGDVDQPVAGRQGGGDRGLRLRRREVRDAQTEHRDGVVIVERDGGDGGRRCHVTCLCMEDP